MFHPRPLLIKGLGQGHEWAQGPPYRHPCKANTEIGPSDPDLLFCVAQVERISTYPGFARVSWLQVGWCMDQSGDVQKCGFIFIPPGFLQASYEGLT